MPELQANPDNLSNEKDENDSSEKEDKMSKADLIHKEQQKFSDLHISFLMAFVDCDYQKVNNILSKDPSLVDMKNPFDGTALHFASKFGDIALIRCLIGNYKADVNAINYGKTPLHYAVEFSREEIASFLVAHYNAKKDIRDYNGKMPIDWAKPDQLEAMEKILGKANYGWSLKEDKGLSVKIKTLGSILNHEGSPKHLISLLKGTDCLLGNQKNIPQSLSTEMFNSPRNFLSLSNAELDKPILRKNLSPRSDKPSHKAGSLIRGSFSGKIN